MYTLKCIITVIDGTQFNIKWFYFHSEDKLSTAKGTFYCLKTVSIHFIHQAYIVFVSFIIQHFVHIHWHFVSHPK